MPAQQIEVPQSSASWSTLDRVDYSDAFCIAVDRDFSELSPESVIKALFKCVPWWVTALMWMRDVAARTLGLKTADSVTGRMRTSGSLNDIGAVLPLLDTFRKDDSEIVIGVNDRHLDFRVSFMIMQHAGRAKVVLGTLVKINNLTGKLYFSVVKPFHVVIMKSIMQKMKRELEIISS